MLIAKQTVCTVQQFPHRYAFSISPRRGAAAYKRLSFYTSSTPIRFKEGLNAVCVLKFFDTRHLDNTSTARKITLTELKQRFHAALAMITACDKKVDGRNLALAPLCLIDFLSVPASS